MGAFFIGIEIQNTIGNLINGHRIKGAHGIFIQSLGALLINAMAIKSGKGNATIEEQSSCTVPLGISPQSKGYAVIELNLLGAHIIAAHQGAIQIQREFALFQSGHQMIIFIIVHLGGKPVARRGAVITGVQIEPEIHHTAVSGNLKAHTAALGAFHNGTVGREIISLEEHFHGHFFCHAAILFCVEPAVEIISVAIHREDIFADSFIQFHLGIAHQIQLGLINPIIFGGSFQEIDIQHIRIPIVEQSRKARSCCGFAGDEGFAHLLQRVQRIHLEFIGGIRLQTCDGGGVRIAQLVFAQIEFAENIILAHSFTGCLIHRLDHIRMNDVILGIQSGGGEGNAHRACACIIGGHLVIGTEGGSHRAVHTVFGISKGFLIQGKLQHPVLADGFIIIEIVPFDVHLAVGDGDIHTLFHIGAILGNGSAQLAAFQFHIMQGSSTDGGIVTLPDGTFVGQREVRVTGECDHVLIFFQMFGGRRAVAPPLAAITGVGGMGMLNIENRLAIALAHCVIQSVANLTFAAPMSAHKLITLYLFGINRLIFLAQILFPIVSGIFRVHQIGIVVAVNHHRFHLFAGFGIFVVGENAEPGFEKFFQLLNVLIDRAEALGQVAGEHNGIHALIPIPLQRFGEMLSLGFIVCCPAANVHIADHTDTNIHIFFSRDAHTGKRKREASQCQRQNQSQSPNTNSLLFHKL